jgi:hypothetical protein
MVADSEDAALAAMREIWGRNTPDGKLVYSHYARLWEKVSKGETSDRKPPNQDAQMKIMEKLERSVFNSCE